MIYAKGVYYQILLLTIFSGSLWCIELERGCQKTQAFKTNALPHVECTHLPKVELPSEVRSLTIQGDLRDIEKELMGPISMIQNLNMSNCNINVLKAHTFYKMKQLMTLILTNNNIEFIEEETFSNLKLLTELHVDGNNLKIIIPGSFKETIYLQILNLQNNQLLEIPAELPKHLTTLNLANNEIEYIDMENLKSLENLQILNLCNNSIFNWPNSISFLQALRHFCLGCSATSPKLLSQSNLENTNISEIKGLEKLELENYIIDNFEFLSHLKNLKILHLLNITYSREEVISLSHLMELHLEMSPAIAHILISSSQNFHQLTTLSLKNNNITVLGQNEAKRLMKNVRNLDISQNPLICLPSEWGWISERMEHNNFFLINSNHTLCNAPPEEKGKPIIKILQVFNQKTRQREQNNQNERKFNTPENYTIKGQEMVNVNQFKEVNLSYHKNESKPQNSNPIHCMLIVLVLIGTFILFLQVFYKITSYCKTLPEQNNMNIQYTGNDNSVNI